MKSKPKITSRNNLLPQKNKSHIRLDQNRANKYPWVLSLESASSVSLPFFSATFLWTPVRKERESKTAHPLNRTVATNCQDIYHDPLKDHGTGVENTEHHPLGHWICSGGTAQGMLYWQGYQWRGSLGSSATRIRFQELEHRVRKQRYGPDPSHSHVRLFLFC